MALQSPQTWDSAIDDFFDHAVSISSLGHNATTPLIAQHTRPDPHESSSSDTIPSYGSGIYSLSSNVPASSPRCSPVTGQDGHISERMQLVWSTEEIGDSASSRQALSDQHHEKTCTKCSLTEAEARKCRLNRRREQNRESQRKFRARKEAKIREAASQVAVLETYVEFLERHNSDLEAVNARLQQQIADFDKDRHVCTFETGALTSHGTRSKEFEIWRSRTPSNVICTSAQESNSAHIPDLHLSLFDHELLPPYNPLADDH